MATVTGLNTLKHQLRKQEVLKQKQLLTGLKAGGLFLQRESQLIVPVDQGPLKASAFTRPAPESTPERPIVLVGYTAEYAIYVHEIPDPPVAHGWSYNAKHRFELQKGLKNFHERGPNQTYKFLEKPAREKRQQILAIIKSFVK